MVNARDLLVYLSIKYEGDYESIIAAIKAREPVNKETLLNEVGALKAKFLTILDDNYPEAFRNMYRPPLVVFYYGDIRLIDNGDNAIAVIGTRHPSEYGVTYTRIITQELTKNNYVIVSGMALGIDSIAHSACLSEGGKTIAVLGSGIDYPYPKSNTKLYHDIIDQGGLILSEYPGDLKPKKENFPFRNRLVAGLVKAVLVTEAHARSGTLITVGYALMLGRDIFCLPHEAGSESSCNRLIKEGAMLVESAEDIMNNLAINL